MKEDSISSTTLFAEVEEAGVRVTATALKPRKLVHAVKTSVLLARCSLSLD